LLRFNNESLINKHVRLASIKIFLWSKVRFAFVSIWLTLQLVVDIAIGEVKVGFHSTSRFKFFWCLSWWFYPHIMVLLFGLFTVHGDLHTYGLNCQIDCKKSRDQDKANVTSDKSLAELLHFRGKKLFDVFELVISETNLANCIVQKS